MSLPRCCILLLSVLLLSPAVRAAEEERSDSNLNMPKIDPTSLIAAGVGAVAAPLVLPAVLGVVGFGAGGIVAGIVCFCLSCSSLDTGCPFSKFSRERISTDLEALFAFFFQAPLQQALRVPLETWRLAASLRPCRALVRAERPGQSSRRLEVLALCWQLGY